MIAEDLGPCEEWAGSLYSNGYGRLWLPGIRKHVSAHRTAWELAFGPLPSGHVIRHKCDNPPCIRLSHLEPGTQLDNIADMHDRGRASSVGHLPQTIPDATIEHVVVLLAQGLLQRIIADMAGVSQATVSRIKHEKARRA